MNGRSSSVLFKHKQLDHVIEVIRRIRIEGGMEIFGKVKDALTRQADEAARINGINKSELSNSITVFNHPNITRVTVERKKRNFR